MNASNANPSANRPQTPSTPNTPTPTPSRRGNEQASAPQNSPPPKSARPPSHAAYHVREIPNRKDKKAIWTRIGSAWPHHDGHGFNIQIDVVPLDGRITLRVAEDKRD